MLTDDQLAELLAQPEVDDEMRRFAARQRQKERQTVTLTPAHMNAMKVAVCDYLLQVNEEHDTGDGHKFIPPTAIDWLGNGIVAAAVRAVRDLLPPVEA